MHRSCNLVLLVCIMAFLSACGHVQAPFYSTAVVSEANVRRFHQGELRYVDAIPLLRLSGDHYEMGLQYGVLMRSRMYIAASKIEGLKDDVIASLPWYVRPVVPLVLDGMLRDWQKRMPGYYLDEIRGMADGSGLSYKTLVFLASGAGTLEESACTAMLAKLGDRLIHGRNFDWYPSEMGEYPVIVEYHPTGKRAFVNFSFVCFPGVLHGINDAGISLTTNIGFGTYKADNKGRPIGFKNREILENATNLAQTDKLIRGFDTDEPGWMITVGSGGEKDGIIYEMYNHTITSSGFDETPYAYAHNILFNPERLKSTELSRRYLDISLGQVEWNLARDATTKTFLKERGIHGIDDMLAYLGDKRYYQYTDMLFTENASINNEYTINTLVFDWDKRAVYYAVAPCYSASSEVYRYDLNVGSLTPYREAEPFFHDPVYKNKVEWYQEVQKLTIAGKYAEALNITDFSGDLGLGQLTCITDAWLKAPEAVPYATMAAAIERQRQKYPDLGLLGKLEGDVYAKAVQEDLAAQNYEQALSARYFSGDVRLEALAWLAEYYHKGKQNDKAVSKARAYTALLDELKQTYHVEKKYAQMEKKMRKLLQAD